MATATPAIPTRARVGAYIGLMKPRIIELLLITTVPAMVLAADGWPGTWLVVATLMGGILSAGGANAINNFVDRDIDEIMNRTAGRPLPQHRVAPVPALVFGSMLGTAGFVWLWIATNLLAAFLSTAALLFYVFVYTMLLKRRTPQNIVIGGAAGAAPALVGWAAVTGSLALPAWILFAIVFYWTPPHFWALSLKYKDDYARAGVPMLPVVAGVRRTTIQIMVYSFVVVLISLALVPVAGMRWLYLGAALVAGTWFIVEAARVHLDPGRAMKLFGYSNIYLVVVLASAWVDVALG